MTSADDVIFILGKNIDDTRIGLKTIHPSSYPPLPLTVASWSFLNGPSVFNEHNKQHSAAVTV